MNSITREYITRELQPGELSHTIKFIADHFSLDSGEVTVSIRRKLSDGAKEVRDNMTCTDLVDICNFETDFQSLRVCFKDSNRTRIKFESSSWSVRNKDKFNISVDSEDNETINTVFYLLSAKLKIKKVPSSTSSFKETIESDLPSRIFKAHHSLLIKEDDIKYFNKFLTDNFEKVKYVVHCIDDTKIPFSSAEEVLNYENPSFKHISKIEIKASSRDTVYTYLDLKIGSSTDSLFGVTAQFILTYEDIGSGIQIEQELINRIKGLRPWYWGLNKIPFKWIFLLLLLLLPLLWNAVSLFQKLRGIHMSQPNSNPSQFTESELFTFNIILVVFLFLLGFIIDHFKSYLFPNIFFCIGKQINEFRKRKNIVDIVVSVIMLGIIISIIGNLLTEKFFG